MCKEAELEKELERLKREIEEKKQLMTELEQLLACRYRLQCAYEELIQDMQELGRKARSF